MDLMNIGDAGGCEKEPQICRPTSLTDTLKEKKARLALQMADLDAALQALDKNPEITTVLELIRRVSRY